VRHALHEHGTAERSHGQHAALATDSLDEPAIDEPAFAHLQIDRIAPSQRALFAVAVRRLCNNGGCEQRQQRYCPH